MASAAALGAVGRGFESLYSDFFPDHTGIMDRFRSIILFGPPGCGKGTQGRHLQAISGHLHISSGEIFRALPADSELGRLYHSYMDQGKLGPDDLTIEIFKEHIEGLAKDGIYKPQEQILLLDGIPRTGPQVELLAPHIDLLSVFVFEMGTKEELIARLQKRAQIEGRADDQADHILENRMEVFYNQTLPALNLLPQDKIVRIKADQAPLYVLRDLLDQSASVLA